MNTDTIMNKDASCQRAVACSPKSKGEDRESISTPVDKHTIEVFDRYLKKDQKVEAPENEYGTDSSTICSPLEQAREMIRTIMDIHKAVATDVSNNQNANANAPTRKRKNEEDTHDAIATLKKAKHDSSEFNDDAREKVTDMLHAFRSIYDMVVQESSIQASEKAYKMFKEKNKAKSRFYKSIGSIPGIKIGDEFLIRVEMFMVGLHRQHQAEIDHIKQGSKKIAISIVSSIRHFENRSDWDILLYPSPTVSKKLVGGNLALKNSIDAQTPVRVIYEIQKFQGRKKRSCYVYDGLYLVEKYWIEESEEGHCVVMFRLRRIAGQPEVAIDETQCSRMLRSSTLCMKDVSHREEDMPIHVVNTFDKDVPTPFRYITKMMLPSSCSMNPLQGCDCVDGCSDSKKCACTLRNGGKIPFNDSRLIVKAKPLVYECGPDCKCPPSCHNRVSQHGVKSQLEIFKTESRGWGVRSPAFIPSGSFICEYTGEILKEEEAQKRAKDEYLFSIGNRYGSRASYSSRNPAKEAGFAVDALKYGNVGRFVNHSCSPNMYAQNVLYDHDDKRMPHIMLFASEDIEPLKELTYDYNYAVDGVHDQDGNVKKKECHCGSSECSGWLY